MSWNSRLITHTAANSCQPLREAVSWNFNRTPIFCWWEQSASSWGCELKYVWGKIRKAGWGQPLREAVSWNALGRHYSWKWSVSLFVRLWVEIVYRLYRLRYIQVSLFVRLWVEIQNNRNMDTEHQSSASSWGCELKYRKQTENTPRSYVSLFVRLWVEI